MPEIPKFIILTGVSGAGKTEAIKCFEDLDFFCIDNLPIKLLDKFCELSKQSEAQLKRIVVVLDLRDENFILLIDKSLKNLKELQIKYNILFLEASENELIRRYSETRRKHPLARDKTVEEGVQKELEILKPVREKADFIIDTTKLSLQDLKNRIKSFFLEINDNNKLNISIISFGYKHGIPENLDLLFDVRFLPNPFYEKELALKTGLDKSVRDYIYSFEVTHQFIKKFNDLLEFLIKEYIKEGKSYLSIGIGCTGGKHRSVTISLALKDMLEKLMSNVSPHLFHKDLYK